MKASLVHRKCMYLYDMKWSKTVAHLDLSAIATSKPKLAKAIAKNC